MFPTIYFSLAILSPDYSLIISSSLSLEESFGSPEVSTPQISTFCIVIASLGMQSMRQRAKKYTKEIFANARHLIDKIHYSQYNSIINHPLR